jgi:hypothetical protein
MNAGEHLFVQHFASNPLCSLAIGSLSFGSNSSYKKLHSLVYPQTTVMMKNAVFWDIMPCGSYKSHNTLTSKKTAVFIVTAVKTSNFTDSKDVFHFCYNPFGSCVNMFYTTATHVSTFQSLINKHFSPRERKSA